MTDLDAIFRALNHPFRRMVLEWLADPEAYFCRAEYASLKGVSAGMVYSKSGLARSTASGHLSILEAAGLIDVRKVGQWVLLSRNDAAIHEFTELIREIFGKHSSSRSNASRQARPQR